jgi:serine/threonine-protein kinase RIM15
MDSGYLSSPLVYADVNSGGSYFNQRTPSVPRLGQSPYFPSTDDLNDLSHEVLAAVQGKRSGKTSDSPLQSFAAELTTDLRSHSHSSNSNSLSGTPPGEQKFVGTPDYLAPETILGLRGDDALVDWVSRFFSERVHRY